MATIWVEKELLNEKGNDKQQQHCSGPLLVKLKLEKPNEQQQTGIGKLSSVLTPGQMLMLMG